jgi:aryl-alcohol dehydrogenase-like predicted oxidoreductase
MKYRPLGRTGLQVSALCLGTMTFGEQNSEAEAHSQLDRALAAGINFIDTAEMYPVPPRTETQGRTEAYIGSWLAKSGQRDNLIIATKAAGPADWLDYLRDGKNRLDRRNIRSAVEDSLRRLRIDVIDLYQVHWPDRETNYFGKLGYRHPQQDHSVPIEETLRALEELVQSGKVRHIGVSNETPWGLMHYLRLAEQAGLPRVASIQNPYSLLNRTFEIGLAEISHREDVGLLAYSPLGFGVLSGKYLNGAWPKGCRLTLHERFSRYSGPEGVAATQTYVELAHKYGMDPAQMALAFVTGQPFVTANIIGATSLAQLEDNLGSLKLELAEEMLEDIEAIHQHQPNPCP